MTDSVGCLSMFVFTSRLSLLMKHLLSSFTQFSEGWGFFLLLRAVYLSGYKSFTRYGVCTYFLPVCVLSFHPLPSVFWRTGIPNFEKVWFTNFSSMDRSTNRIHWERKWPDFFKESLWADTYYWYEKKNQWFLLNMSNTHQHPNHWSLLSVHQLTVNLTQPILIDL